MFLLPLHSPARHVDELGATVKHGREGLPQGHLLEDLRQEVLAGVGLGKGARKREKE